MSYVLFDDKFHSHEKVASLFDGECPGDALGLYALALSWCGDKLTDGFVSAGWVARSGLKPKAAAELVRVKLWHRSDDVCADCAAVYADTERNTKKPEPGGYVVHGYLERNPTKHEVLQKREAAAKRKNDWVESKRREREEQQSQERGGNNVPDRNRNATGTRSVTASVTALPTTLPTTHYPLPTTHVPLPTSQNTHASEGGADAPPRRQRAKPAVPDDPLGEQIARSAVWDAYRVAYFDRYGAEPLSNAKIRGQIKHFVQRVPRDEAPAIVTAYLRSNNARYVAAGHSFGPLLQDAEAVRTEAVTGKSRTQWGARDADKRDGRRQDYEELFTELRKRDEAKEAGRLQS